MVEANVELVQVKDLKVGKLVVIDGEPCKVVSIDKSKTGKHGAMKARVEAISLFTSNKKGLMKPVSASAEVPIITKKNAQIIAKLGNNRIQLMDLRSYETFEMDVPEDFQNQIEAGKEVEIQEVMGKRMLARVK
jgi:translation initiation factor 5A